MKKIVALCIALVGAFCAQAQLSFDLSSVQVKNGFKEVRFCPQKGSSDTLGTAIIFRTGDVSRVMSGRSLSGSEYPAVIPGPVCVAGMDTDIVEIGGFGIDLKRIESPSSFLATTLVNKGVVATKLKKDTAACYTFIIQQQRSCWSSADSVAKNEVTGGVMFWAVVHFTKPVKLSAALNYFKGMTKQAKCPDQQMLDLKMTVTVSAWLLPSGPVKGPFDGDSRYIVVM